MYNKWYNFKPYTLYNKWSNFKVCSILDHLLYRVFSLKLDHLHAVYTLYNKWSNFLTIHPVQLMV